MEERVGSASKDEDELKYPVKATLISNAVHRL